MRHKIDLELCVAALRKLADEPTRYEDLRKHVIKTTACGSSWKVNRAIHDLAVNGWIQKQGSRGSQAAYVVTERGKLFLKSLRR